jgi:hypothetical protein
MALLEHILAKTAERKIIIPLILLDLIFAYSLKCRNFRSLNSFSTALATNGGYTERSFMIAFGQ